MSLKEDPPCKDCMRRCAPLTRDLSGELSVERFEGECGPMELSRALSLRAACAAWMADEEPARDVGATGDCGFNGSGGGARSGSELSHLVLFSLRQRTDIATSFFF